MTPEQLDDIIRGFLYTVTNREEVAQETIPLGAAIGTLNADEAAQFAATVDDYLTAGGAA